MNKRPNWMPAKLYVLLEITQFIQICTVKYSVRDQWNIQIFSVFLAGMVSVQRTWLCTARALAPCPLWTWLPAMRALQSSSTPRSPLAWGWPSPTPRRLTALMPFQSECTRQTDGMWYSHYLSSMKKTVHTVSNESPCPFTLWMNLHQKKTHSHTHSSSQTWTDKFRCVKSFRNCF